MPCRPRDEGAVMVYQPRTLLKVLVDQRKWPYATFERKFTATADQVIGKGARNPTVSESQFRRWTAGRIKGLPGPDACQVLEAMFGVEPAALFAPPPSQDPDIPAFNLEDELAMTAHDAQNDAGATAAESISDTTVDQLRDDIAALARDYNARPAYDVFREARMLREQAESLRERTQVPAQQQELLILGGQACALLSQTCFDLGSLDNSIRLARSAALYGESARFEPLRAFASGTLACIGYFRSSPAQAVRHIQQAQAFAGIGDVGQRRLRAIEARAYAHLGNSTAAQHALRESQVSPRGVTDDLHDGVGGEFGFTDERLAMSNGSTALLIGDAAQAEACAQHALTLISTRPAGRRSAPVIGGAAANMALIRLVAGDLDAAAEALETLWSVPRDQRVTGLLARTAQLRRALTHERFHGSPLAADLGERIEDFVQQSAQRQLGTGAETLALEA